jgi:hypothetical protein
MESGDRTPAKEQAAPNIQSSPGEGGQAPAAAQTQERGKKVKNEGGSGIISIVLRDQDESKVERLGNLNQVTSTLAAPA